MPTSPGTRPGEVACTWVDGAAGIIGPEPGSAPVAGGELEHAGLPGDTT
ncbi:hypothetical protein [Streptomyces clavifer]